jgi:hypothetical protein
MSVKNDTSGTHLANSTMAANTHEQRITATVGTGREVMKGAGANATSPANTFEQRCAQETGTH